jgi:hypothetical protein
MARKNLEVGDLVEILSGDHAGSVGIVSMPITEQQPGHVLLHNDGFILGRDVSIGEIQDIDESSEGFAQLGYFLIKLGSHVIEKKLLLYRT